MSYAIISVGGKQYRVREGERLLVDRLGLEDGASFTPTVLLTGGSGGPQIAPAYKRHTGFRASLTRIQIESIGGAAKRERAKPKSEPAAPAAQGETPSALPEGYADLTVAGVKEAAPTWDAAARAAALEYEQAHGKRKGAIAALEAAIAEEES
jgi:ribosomal protein L21